MEGLADSGPNFAVDHIQDRIRETNVEKTKENNIQYLRLNYQQRQIVKN